jgi:hypothetical protein
MALSQTGRDVIADGRLRRQVVPRWQSLPIKVESQLPPHLLLTLDDLTEWFWQMVWSITTLTR